MNPHSTIVVQSDSLFTEGTEDGFRVVLHLALHVLQALLDLFICDPSRDLLVRQVQDLSQERTDLFRIISYRRSVIWLCKSRVDVSVHVLRLPARPKICQMLGLWRNLQMSDLCYL